LHQQGGLIKIIAQGGDADTNAAVACSVLGAKFGYSSIPVHYIAQLHKRQVLLEKINLFLNELSV
jgi:ADP-ribosylglycohydrolase